MTALCTVWLVWSEDGDEESRRGEEFVDSFKFQTLGTDLGDTTN
jgi:hypothetical protein